MRARTCRTKSLSVSSLIVPQPKRPLPKQGSRRRDVAWSAQQSLGTCRVHNDPSMRPQTVKDLIGNYYPTSCRRDFCPFELKMISQRAGRCLESFLEVVCFILTEHEPVTSHMSSYGDYVVSFLDHSGYHSGIIWSSRQARA